MAVIQDQTTIELANSLALPDIPIKLRCATCNRLALNAFKLPCCNQSICAECQTTLPDTCPVCMHSPLDGSVCAPNKSLRLTVKAYLKSEERKRVKETSSAIATLQAMPSTVNEAPVISSFAGDVASSSKEETSVAAEEVDTPRLGETLDTTEQSIVLLEAPAEGVRPDEEEQRHADDEVDEDEDEQELEIVTGDEPVSNQASHAPKAIGHDWSVGTDANNFANADSGAQQANVMMNIGMPGAGFGAFAGMMGMPGMAMNFPNMFNGFGGMGMGDMNAMNSGMGMGMGNFGGWTNQQQNLGGNFGFLPNGGGYMQQGSYGNQMRQFPNQNYNNRFRGQGFNRGFNRGGRGQFRGRGNFNQHGSFNQQQTFSITQEYGDQLGYGQSSGTNDGYGDASDTVVVNGEEEKDVQAGLEGEGDERKPNDDQDMADVQGQGNGQAPQSGHMEDALGASHDFETSNGADRNIPAEREDGSDGRPLNVSRPGHVGHVHTDAPSRPAPPPNAPTGPRAMRQPQSVAAAPRGRVEELRPVSTTTSGKNGRSHDGHEQHREDDHDGHEQSRGHSPAGKSHDTAFSRRDRSSSHSSRRHESRRHHRDSRERRRDDEDEEAKHRRWSRDEPRPRERTVSPDDSERRHRSTKNRLDRSSRDYHERSKDRSRDERKHRHRSSSLHESDRRRSRPSDNDGKEEDYERERRRRHRKEAERDRDRDRDRNHERDRGRDKDERERHHHRHEPDDRERRSERKPRGRDDDRDDRTYERESKRARRASQSLQGGRDDLSKRIEASRRKQHNGQQQRQSVSSAVAKVDDETVVDGQSNSRNITVPSLPADDDLGFKIKGSRSAATAAAVTTKQPNGEAFAPPTGPKRDRDRDRDRNQSQSHRTSDARPSSRRGTDDIPTVLNGTAPHRGQQQQEKEPLLTTAAPTAPADPYALEREARQRERMLREQKRRESAAGSGSVSGGNGGRSGTKRGRAEYDDDVDGYVGGAARGGGGEIPTGPRADMGRRGSIEAGGGASRKGRRSGRW